MDLQTRIQRTAIKPNRWAVVKRYWDHHRLHIIVCMTVVVYLVTHVIKLEFLGHGCELLVEPTIELLLIKFTGIGD